MKKPMDHHIKTIALIGATGKAGRYLLPKLISKGYTIHVLVRNPERLAISHPAIVKIITGDAVEQESIAALIKGTDAVVSTLGMGIPPSEPTIFGKATRMIIQTMNLVGIKRYITTTGLNVDTPFDKKGEATTAATKWMYTNFPKSTADRQLEYELLVESKIDWTLVRLPLIELDAMESEVNVSLEDCRGMNIKAGSLAAFLANQLEDDTYVNASPFLANA
jgi:putative NADH-flavin reductase